MIIHNSEESDVRSRASEEEFGTTSQVSDMPWSMEDEDDQRNWEYGNPTDGAFQEFLMADDIPHDYLCGHDFKYGNQGEYNRRQLASFFGFNEDWIEPPTNSALHRWLNDHYGISGLSKYNMYHLLCPLSAYQSALQQYVSNKALFTLSQEFALTALSLSTSKKYYRMQDGEPRHYKSAISFHWDFIILMNDYMMPYFTDTNLFPNKRLQLWRGFKEKLYYAAKHYWGAYISELATQYASVLLHHYQLGYNIKTLLKYSCKRRLYWIPNVLLGFWCFLRQDTIFSSIELELIFDRRIGDSFSKLSIFDAIFTMADFFTYAAWVHNLWPPNPPPNLIRIFSAWLGNKIYINDMDMDRKKNKRSSDLQKNRYFMAYHTRHKEHNKYVWKPSNCHQWHYHLVRIPKSDWKYFSDIARHNLRKSAETVLGVGCFNCWGDTRPTFAWDSDYGYQ